MSHGGPLVEVRNLLVRRGRFSLEVPYLEVRVGEILSLVGPNGSGKTTLLMALGLLISPKKGSILFSGQPTYGLRSPLDLRRRIAMVFQEPLLLSGTVLDNGALGLKLRGVRGRALRSKAMEALERLGVAHLRNRSVRDLSGGEAQRVSLARALAVEPELLLLDEPFSSLDPPTRDQLLDDLEGVLRATGTTAVMTTHDRLDGLAISHRVAVVYQGRILQVGSPRDMIQRPSHPFVAHFLNLQRTARALAWIVQDQGNNPGQCT